MSLEDLKEAQIDLKQQLNVISDKLQKLEDAEIFKAEVLEKASETPETHETHETHETPDEEKKDILETQEATEIFKENNDCCKDSNDFYKIVNTFPQVAGAIKAPCFTKPIKNKCLLFDITEFLKPSATTHCINCENCENCENNYEIYVAMSISCLIMFAFFCYLLYKRLCEIYMIC